MRLGAPCADQDPGQLRRQRSVRGVDGASPASVPPASGPSNARTEQRGMAAGCRTASCWACTRISQPQHYGHFGLNNSSLWRTVLCVVGC
ncbi:zinc finger protein 26 isoform X5 [Diceros bicornis minor]|uniref:zinc finger protein 26 isoform X5 n=1 Tax=Diceros bicornis minor TaxID=77932 RepID=UPI0026E9D5DE|nr:zinc finger protein 26 isoform X5 [Diceros bicornis minor]